VNVERERVNVEEARVEVERRALENRQTFDRAAIEFETTKLRIEADKDVQMAMAAALGQFMSKGNYNIYGDPTTMSQMFTQYAQGMGFSNKVDGLLKTLPGPLADLISGMGPQASGLLEEFVRTRMGNGHDKPQPPTPAAAAVVAPPAADGMKDLRKPAPEDDGAE
jgi:hypothetical protein